MNIKQVIQKSKEYHSAIDPNEECKRYYQVDDYQCAVGCNLKSPWALQQYAEGVDVYAIDEVVRALQDDEQPDYDYSQEPLLVEAIENPKFLKQLEVLQNLHDNCSYVKDYLEALEKFDYNLDEANNV